MIIDSARAYFGSSIDIVSFVKSLVNYADQIGTNGVTVWLTWADSSIPVRNMRLYDSADGHCCIIPPMLMIH